MELLQVIVLIACSLVVAISIMEWWAMRKILKRSEGWEKLEHPFVMESLIGLKTGQKLFSSLLAIITIAFTFFGYNELQGIRRDVQKNAIDSASTEINKFVEQKTKEMNQLLKVDAQDVVRKAGEIQNSFTASQRYLALLKEGSKNIKYYIVKDIDFYSKIADNAERRFSFSELKPKGISSLPVFENPPEVLVISEGADITVKQITRDSIIFFSFGDVINRRFDLWIFPQ